MLLLEMGFRARLLAFVLAIAAGPAGAQQTAPAPCCIPYDRALYGPEIPLPEILQGLGVAGPFVPAARVEVWKSAYMLKLYSGERLLKTYRIELGRQPIGPKRFYGDGRTPEGSYAICHHNPNSRYHLSLQIDYPNEADIARGLDSLWISSDEAEELRKHRAQGVCPRAGTALGGEIFLHGQDPKTTERLREEQADAGRRAGVLPGDVDPATMDLGQNWTLGCVALTNPDIRELYAALPDGTPVEILP
ncbi:MAG: L,D-transpeptidase family protein [Candidatus Eisenbacteria bacterium]|nr:L,D-transpeptidase family protein [Candidatus Eisenbacteria bacterium]